MFWVQNHCINHTMALGMRQVGGHAQRATAWKERPSRLPARTPGWVKIPRTCPNATDSDRVWLPFGNIQPKAFNMSGRYHR